MVRRPLQEGAERLGRSGILPPAGVRDAQPGMRLEHFRCYAIGCAIGLNLTLAPREIALGDGPADVGNDVGTSRRKRLHQQESQNQ